MKEWILILFIALSLSLLGCKTDKEVEQHIDKSKRYITIDGCEYLMVGYGYQGYMAKVDCSCVPEK